MTIQTKPILFLDVDGVISLFGFSPTIPALPGPIHWVDGVAHCIPDDVGERVTRLSEHFDLVWATGWEQRANEHLPGALGLGPFPHLSFDRVRKDSRHAHWKLGAIEAHAGPERPVAWVDDQFDASCDAWAASRPGPTLLVRTDPAVGLTRAHADALVAWAAALGGP